MWSLAGWESSLRRIVIELCVSNDCANHFLWVSRNMEIIRFLASFGPTLTKIECIIHYLKLTITEKKITLLKLKWLWAMSKVCAVSEINHVYLVLYIYYYFCFFKLPELLNFQWIFLKVLGKIWTVALKHHFRMPPYYTLVLRSLASLEGKLSIPHVDYFLVAHLLSY